MVGELVQQNMAETRPMETETAEDPQAKKVDEFVQALQKPKNGHAPRGSAGNPKLPKPAKAQSQTYTSETKTHLVARQPKLCVPHLAAADLADVASPGRKAKRLERLRTWRGQKRKNDQLVTAKLSPVSQLFLDVMKGATAQDWIWLLKFDVLRKLVYWYDIDDASVHSPTVQQVEWPIIWILTRYHKKYLWCSNLPDLSWIAEDLSQWRNKVGWAWFFRNTPSKGYGFKPVRRQKTATCTVKLPKELHAWMNEMHRRIIVCLQHDISKNRNYSNTLGVTKLGLQRLKHSKLAVIPTDKDGGYAVFERHNLRVVHEKILSSSAYIVCGGVDWIALKHQCCSLCKTVDRACGERGQLERQLLRSTRQLNSRVTCILGITVKSHKPKGLVKCRNLHKSKAYSFEGLSAWTEYEFKSQLKPYKHILRNSAEFVRKVTDAKINTALSS